MRKHVVFGALLVLAACGESGSRHTDPTRATNAPAPGTSAVDRPHVVFTVPSLTVQRLGAPVPAPVTTPSRPSRDTMASDDPGVVDVSLTGELVGVRPGTARVRAVGGGSELLVTVVAPRALRLDPAVLQLAPGEQARVRVLDESGAEVAGEAVTWSAPDGVPLALAHGLVASMGAPGEFRVTARAGDAEGSLEVRVAVPAGQELRVSPPRVKMRVGQVRAFQAMSTQGGVRATWSSGDGKVLLSMGEGLFEARRRGRVQVCARAFERTSCSDVEVTP